MCRVLCIEDDVETRILLKKTLEAAGMSVDTVWGGEKGLDALRTQSFDCVVLDIMMPHMDGLQVLHSLRSQAATQDVAVLFLTGKADTETRERALAAGANGFMTKPFEIAKLVETVWTLSARARAE